MSLQTANEAQLKRLMLAGLAGDTAAHRELFDRPRLLLRTYYRPRLSRIGRDTADAEDLIQDVLMVIHTRAGTYDPHQRLMPWLYTVARHKFIDHLRRTRVFLASVPLDAAGELAAGKGILMRTGEAFQGFRLVRQIVLDKTGTLTEGRPWMHEIDVRSITEDELLTLAAAAEASSEHPLAEAVVKAAFERGLDLPRVHAFEAHPGKGVVARLDEAELTVGSPAFMAERGVDLAPLSEAIRVLEEKGRTVLILARDTRVLGLLAVGDALRPDTVASVAALEQAGLETILVTGDNERAARRIAAEARIDHVHAGVLPGGKAELVRELQKGGMVAMVGDGINDAPALMQADVGIAMGGGTDIAIDSADIIILSNRLAALPEARGISARGYRKMVQNVTLAFLFNGIGIPIAATGLLYPIWAMMAMTASVTAIFINSLGERPRLFFDAISTIGRPVEAAAT